MVGMSDDKLRSLGTLCPSLRRLGYTRISECEMLDSIREVVGPNIKVCEYF